MKQKIKEYNATPLSHLTRKLVSQKTIKERKLQAKSFLKIKNVSEKIYDYIKRSDLEVGRLALEQELKSNKKAPTIFTLQKRFERKLRVEKIKRKQTFIADDRNARVEKGLEIYEKQINLVDIEKYKMEYQT